MVSSRRILRMKVGVTVSGRPAFAERDAVSHDGKIDAIQVPMSDAEQFSGDFGACVQVIRISGIFTIFGDDLCPGLRSPIHTPTPWRPAEPGKHRRGALLPAHTRWNGRCFHWKTTGFQKSGLRWLRRPDGTGHYRSGLFSTAGPGPGYRRARIRSRPGSVAYPGHKCTPHGLCANRVSTTWDPMKPDPPVTMTLIQVSAISSGPSAIPRGRMRPGLQQPRHLVPPGRRLSCRASWSEQTYYLNMATVTRKIPPAFHLGVRRRCDRMCIFKRCGRPRAAPAGGFL